MLNQNIELKETYFVYQSLLSTFKEKDYSSFIKILNDDHTLISDYMKTSLNDLMNLKITFLTPLTIIITMGLLKVTTTLLKLSKELLLVLDLFADLKRVL